MLIGPKQDAAAPLTLTGTVTGLSVSPSTLDFGDIPDGQLSLPQTITVTNASDQELEVPVLVAANGSPSPAGISDKAVLVAFKTPGACLATVGGGTGPGAVSTISVPAAGSCEVGVKVEVTPAAGELTVGAFTVPVLLGPKTDATPLTLTGTGTGLSVSPSPLAFGDVPDGQLSLPQTVTVTNASDQELEVPVALAADGSPSPAGISDTSVLVPLGTPGACVGTVAVGTGTGGKPRAIKVPASGSCEVGVKVEVTPAAGEETVGAFTVPVLLGPKTDATPLTLTGTGTGLSVSPSPLAFGDVADGQESLPQTVTVTNATDQELPLSLATGGSPSPAGISDRVAFEVLKTPGACLKAVAVGTGHGAPPVTVPASSSCEVGIKVDVTPATGEPTVGEFTIPLLLGPKADAAPLTLTGTGTGLSVSPSPVAFGDVPDGQLSLPQTITVTNASDQELEVPVLVAANGSPSPAGISDKAVLVAFKTPGACLATVGGGTGPGAVSTISVPAAGSCEVGVKVEVTPAAGELTVGAFTVPVLVGPKADAAPLTLTGTGTGLSVSPSPLAFGDVADGQLSAPQTITVTNVTGQELPLSLATGGSPSPAGISDRVAFEVLKTPGACLKAVAVGTGHGAPPVTVPASSSCEVGIKVDVTPATGEPTVGEFTIPVLVGPKTAAASLTLTGTGL